MASIAGNKRRHHEHTLDVKYAVLMKIDRGISNKDVLNKINVPKKCGKTCPRGRRTGKK